MVPKIDFFVRSNISATYRSSSHLKRPYFGIIYFTLQIRLKEYNTMSVGIEMFSI